MRTNRLAVLASVLFMAVVSGGAFHHGSAPIAGANWHEALEKVPCQNITKVGDVLQINVTVIVGGESHPNPTITDEGQIKMLEKKCFPKH
jgi:hypothetical protein